MSSKKFLLPLFRSYSTKSLKWEPWEDQLLLEYIKHNGKKWSAVSQHCLPNRLPGQCEVRWDTVNPDFKKGSFSSHETQLLRKGIEKYGKNWAAIQTEFLPNRGVRRLSNETHNTTTQPRKEWTKEEDDLLIKGVAEFGLKGWTKIATKYLPHRSKVQISYRYKVYLDPSSKKDTKLTQEELDLILKRTIIFGQNWDKVAEGLPGRTPERCASAWLYTLDPSLNKGPWTPKEERLLWELLCRLDGIFYKAAEYLPGRNRVSCRRRFWSQAAKIQHLFPEQSKQMNDENRNDWIKRMAGLLCNMNDNKIDLRLHPNGALKLHQAGNWTEKEIHELKQLVQDKLESQNELPKAAWEEIAGHFPRFSAEQCKYYYLSHIKVPNRRKGAWSEQEDELLKSLVKEHGTSWSIIAEKFPNRNQLQCSYRWHRVLKYSDAIKSGRLTDQEKLLIKEGVLMFGNNWEAIRTTYLPHRTPIQCMRWWNFQLRKSDTVDDEDISIKPEMNRWTDDEDKILSFVVSGYQDDAEISWSKVANMVPGRNAAQCRTRWLYSLKPDVGKRWTYDEGMQLLEIVHKLKLTDLKNIWPTVSKELNTGRDDWQCRRKYNYMLRTGNRFAV